MEGGNACLLPSSDSPIIFYSIDDLFGLGFSGSLGSLGDISPVWGVILVETASYLRSGNGYGPNLPPIGQSAINAEGIVTGYMDNSALVDLIMGRRQDANEKSTNTIAEVAARAFRGNITYRLWLENNLLRGESVWSSGFDIGGGIGVATVGILAAIAIPNFIVMQRRAKRAEVPSNVSGIKSALLAYDAEFDVYIEANQHPATQPGPQNMAWGNGNDGFNQLGWAPDGAVRGQYWVTTTTAGKRSPAGDFTVWGRSDIDGDGIFATYTATRSINTSFHNNNDTF